MQQLAFAGTFNMFQGTRMKAPLGLKAAASCLALAWIVLFAAESHPADLPEVRGLVSIGRRHTVYFSSPAGGRVIFKSIGGVVDGYIVESYDEATGEVTLAKEGQRFRQTVPDGRVQNAPLLSREDALAYFHEWIGEIEAVTRSYSTYRPLPANDISILVAKAGKDAALHRKESAEEDGGRLFVTSAPDGLPLVITGRPIAYDRLPKGVVANLNEEDRAVLNEAFMTAHIHRSYVAYLSHRSTGHIRPK